MIESISLNNIATYSPNKTETVSNLKAINFFYGANGAGKTTISRLINKPEISADSRITWLRNILIPAMVYNNDFIKDNYKDSEDLKGVFTLGKVEKDQLDRLQELKKEKSSREQLKVRSMEMLNGDDSKGGKNSELKTLEAKLVGRCWDQKVKYDEIFKEAFTGVRNNKDAFKIRVLQEATSNRSELADLTDLKERALVLYCDAPSPINTVANLDLSRLIGFETSPVLIKKVIGKDDVSISEMIQRLGNSDWVRQGIKFLEHTGDQCPFCQQGTPHNFEKSLADYFDETFEAGTRAVAALRASYFQTADDLLVQARNIAVTECAHLDREKFALEVQTFEAILVINKDRVEKKLLSPSISIELEGLEDIYQKIIGLIRAANVKVVEHNRIVSSFKAEQKKLAGEVWKYILEVELKDALADYSNEKWRLEKAILGITTSLDKANEDLVNIQNEIDKIEMSLTSVKPTVIAINKILKNFGFRSFSLDPACTGNSYRLIRADGTEAKATLSEGEKTFVTFLYFYHLLKGSITASGIATDRIVVIDDPVSSLDSDVLFIVGSLIKQLFAEVRQKGSNLKQIFILTHNVHFHKEITFDQRRPAEASLGDESFWIVRKPGDHSAVEFHTSNPIRTSYQLLWAELKKMPVPALTLQNTMRRILENYFKILGGIDTNKLVNRFEGHEKIQCQSLISWINDGSHYAPDELYVAIGDAMASSYMKIFFKIFKVTDHMAHYQMMMGNDYVDLDPKEEEIDEEDVALADLASVPPILLPVVADSIVPTQSAKPPIVLPLKSAALSLDIGAPDPDIPF